MSLHSSPAAPQPTGTTPSWRRSVGVLAVATIAIGLANYLVAIAGVHLLPADQFADFAAGQGLLLVLGTGSFAALPWAVARYLARSADPDALQKAMHFGLTGAVLQAFVLAPVAFAVCWSLGGLGFGIAGGVATFMISVLAGPVGFLQGRQLLPAIAAVRSIETAGRIVATLVFVLLVSRNATLALLGFPVGSALALAYALRRGRAGFPMRRLPRAVAMRLTRDAALLGGIQVLLAMLGALDTVYVDGAHFGADQAASYQSAALLARIPLFFSAAIATAAYTEMAAAPDEATAGRQLRAALRTYAWLAVPFLVAYLTLPQSLLDLLIPSRYADTLGALKALCFSGVLIGLINVITTAHQARGRFRGCLTILGIAVLGQAVTLLTLGRFGSVVGYAAGASIVCALAVIALVRDARGWLRGPRPALRLRWQHVVIVLAALAAAIVHQPVIWLVVMAVVAVGCAALGFAGRHDADGSPHTAAAADVVADVVGTGPDDLTAFPAATLRRRPSPVSVSPRPRPRPRPRPAHAPSLATAHRSTAPRIQEYSR